MGSIYDKKKNVQILQGSSSFPNSSNSDRRVQTTINQEEYQPIVRREEQNIAFEYQQNTQETTVATEISSFQERSLNALSLVDDVVLKNYLTKLQDMDIVPCPTNLSEDNIILFKINKMVYEKDEYATDKFESIVSAMTYTNSSIFLIVDGNKVSTDFYLGIKCEDEHRGMNSIADTFKNSLLGQFPGASIEDVSYIETGATHSKQQKLFSKIKEAKSVSSCSVVPSYKNSKGEYTNNNFIQGIEKFALAMQGKVYTAVILAQNTSSQEIANVRFGYEHVYTELSAMATQQLAYSTNESLANAITRTKGTSNSNGHTDSVNSSRTNTFSQSNTIGSSQSHTNGFSQSRTSGSSKSHSSGSSQSYTSGSSTSHTDGIGESKENGWGKAGKLAGPLMKAGAVLTLASGGLALPVAVGMMAAGGALGIAGSLFGKQESKNISDTTSFNNSSTKSFNDSATRSSNNSYTSSSSKSDSVSTNRSETKSTSNANTNGESHSDSVTRTESFSESNGNTSTIGSSKNFTITIQSKRIQEMMKRIDKQLERVNLCESTGLWSTAAYFLSYNNDRATAETGATIFRSIMQGEQSGVESSSVSTWYDNRNDARCTYLAKYVSAMTHPMFFYNNNSFNSSIEIMPTSLVSSKELSLLMGLPRKSVPGLPVVEHAPFAKEVLKFGNEDSHNKLEIGCIFDQGVERTDNNVWLDAKSLTQHTFVTGSTGCGKSETVYQLIKCVKQLRAKFLIIEPTKGEYKNVFGNDHVYGTNPLVSNLLRINPFKFPKGVHVLEHADRLIEIFNVCWPMYAAMPAVLKEAVLNAYEDCGWDLLKSTNEYSDELFPTFSDLIQELDSVVTTSAYSEEVKSNYRGSLVTRVKSLANGINGEIFSGKEIGDAQLFDENAIVDLSRIGSQETKALIMGILIMRLNEYRANSGHEPNSDLQHVTVLEEAHNILKRCSQEQTMEGSNIAGKSVEMLSNSIAEMRTYGEGFIIVDQSPSAVDIAAIRNTNTKIIMRLPDEADRKVAGKSAAMKDFQIDEIAKLPTGVAVIYQNDWEEPVLCKIGQCPSKERFKYEFHEDIIDTKNECIVKCELLKLLLKGRMSTNIEIDIHAIDANVDDLWVSSFVKIIILEALAEYRETQEASIWNNNNFEKLSRVVTEILGVRQEVAKLVGKAKSFDVLTTALKNIIIEKVQGNLPSSTFNVIEQCLMRDYSIRNEEATQIYTYWLQQKKKLV